jgi:preprotein translocase subunit YajC
MISRAREEEKRFRFAFFQVKLAKSGCIPRFINSFNYMNLFGLNPTLAFAQSSQPGQSAPPAWTSLVPLVLLIVVFYFALIRPQQKKSKEHAELLKSVHPGDKIVTSSGIIGVIVAVKDKTVSIRSADAKFEITKVAIAEIVERDGEVSES